MSTAKEIAKSKLAQLMKEEWSEFNDKYFKGTEPFVTLDDYAKKFISTNSKERILYKEKFQELLGSISFDDVYAKRDYDVLVYRKKLLEFPFDDPTSYIKINKFMDELVVQQEKINQLEIYLKNPPTKTL